MTDQGTRSPDRPPCATSFLAALEPNGSQRDIDQAVEAASSASLQTDCINCLGRLGTQDTKIRCPVKFEGGVAYEQLKAMRSMQVVEISRLKRSLDGSISEPIPALDVPLARALSEIGFTQADELVNMTLTNTPPEKIVPNNEKGTDNTEIALEKRPLCAGLLARAYEERAAAIDEWRLTNLPREKGYRQTLDHSKDEATYAKAIKAAELADPKNDCPDCLGENCPLLHLVPLKTLYDATNRESSLPSGAKVTTSEVIVEINKGHSRKEFTGEVIDKLDTKLHNRATEAGGKFNPAA